MISGSNSGFSNLRRWPRHQVQLPVRVATCDRVSKIVVPGLATEISRGGMALYGGLPMKPGDLMAVEFRTASPLRVAGIVRHKAGFCYGLEFFAVMTQADDAKLLTPVEVPAEIQTRAWPSESTPTPSVSNVPRPSAPPSPAEQRHAQRWWEQHEAYMRRTEEEIARAQKELERIRTLQQRIDSLRQDSVRTH